MLETRLEPEREWWQLVVVRLLRRWSAANATGANSLPAVFELASALGVRSSAAVALASLYQLTESCLERRIVTECCCSPQIAGDERAILMLIAAAPAPGEALASLHIPHGLPGALAWAAAAVRHELALESRECRALHCPFNQQAQTAIASYSH